MTFPFTLPEPTPLICAFIRTRERTQVAGGSVYVSAGNPSGANQKQAHCSLREVTVSQKLEELAVVSPFKLDSETLQLGEVLM